MIYRTNPYQARIPQDPGQLTQSFPGFLHQPAPSVRFYHNPHAAPKNYAEDGSFRLRGWNGNFWGHVAGSPKTLDGLMELAQLYKANNHRIPDRYLEKDWPLHETCFNWRDKERPAEMAHHLLGLQPSPDVVVLQEVFDPAAAEDIWSVMQDEYPYAVISASGRGIPGILLELALRWPAIAGALEYRGTPIQSVINGLLGGYYPEGPQSMAQTAKALATEVLIPTRRVMALTSALFEDPYFWGAGIMILSRHPILNFGYQSHPSRTDFEFYTDKGTLWADIQMRDGILRAGGVHMNDGAHRINQMVRRDQSIGVRSLMLQSPYPSVMMVDMNDEAGSAAHETLADARYGIHNAYHCINGDRGRISFHPQNPFAFIKGSDKAITEKPSLIDHSFIRRLQALSVMYPDDRFGPDPSDPGFMKWLTDHFPVDVHLRF